MSNSVIIPYEVFTGIITGYGAWVYASAGISLLDTDKKLYFRIHQNQAEIAVKSSSVLIKSKIDVKTELENPDKPWDFILEYKQLKGIIETYQKLACTYIEDVMFQTDETDSRIIKLTMKEMPKEGYPEEYAQYQKYKFQQVQAARMNSLFEGMEIPERFEPVSVRHLADLSDIIVPKLLLSKEDNNKMQFEVGQVFVKDMNSLFCYRNPCPDTLKDGFVLGIEGASVLRSMLKSLRGMDTIPLTVTETHLVMTPANMIIYITKGSLIKPLKSVLKKQNVVFDIVVNSGYLLDILKRYNNAEDEISVTFYADTKTGYMQANGITQRLYLESLSERADQQKIYISTKLFQKMIMRADGNIKISFVERKGRSRSGFYMCYLSAEGDSPWTSILYVRKG